MVINDFMNSQLPLIYPTKWYAHADSCLLTPVTNVYHHICISYCNT